MANVRYQGYRLVTGNRDALRSDHVRRLAGQISVSAVQAWFAAVRTLGMVAVTGSTNEDHLRDALLGTAGQQDAGRAIELERWLGSGSLRE